MASGFDKYKSGKGGAKPAAPAKGEWTPKEDFVGDFKNITTKAGVDMQIIEVAQDIVLKKGQLLVFQSLEDKLNWQVSKGYKTDAEKAEFLEQHGERLNGSFRAMPARET